MACDLADLRRPRLAHVGFVRSTEAHADILKIDADGVWATPGVLDVLTYADLSTVSGEPVPANRARTTSGPATRCTTHWPKDRVRYVGEAVVAVVAETQVLRSPTRPHSSRSTTHPTCLLSRTPHQRPRPAPRLCGTAGRTTSPARSTRPSVTQRAAFADADVTLRHRLAVQRQTGASMEGRGAVAEWDDIGELALWTSTQGPHIARDFLSEVSGGAPHRVQSCPQIGVASAASSTSTPRSQPRGHALAAKRPVIWIEGRRESFVATVHAREQIVEVEARDHADGKITGIRAT